MKNPIPNTNAARFPVTPQAAECESPEATGRYECPRCGNRTRFVGYDDNGFPGAGMRVRSDRERQRGMHL